MEKSMETLEAIFTRRSVREYSPEAVPDALVHELLAAAMQAPSAGNQQSWQFVIVTEREQLNALAAGLRYGQSLNTAPLGIAVCADLRLTKFSDAWWIQDCSAATQNLLLAAHARGLGGVWLGIYPVAERVADVQKVLGLPEQVIPLSIVSLGYPVSRPEPPARRYDEARLHHNHW
jgi:nitroreductase